MREVEPHNIIRINDYGMIILLHEKGYFIAQLTKDGWYERKTIDGLTIRTRDFDYLAIGAKFYQTLTTASKWLKLKTEHEHILHQEIKK